MFCVAEFVIGQFENILSAGVDRLIAGLEQGLPELERLWAEWDAQVIA